LAVLDVRKAVVVALWSVGPALGLCMLTIQPAGAATSGAATPSVAATPFLEGGAIGTFATLTLGRWGTFHFAKPAVVTPPGGGSADAALGPISFGGYPPFYPPVVSIGASTVHTDGTISDGSTFDLPLVRSTASVAGLSLLSRATGLALTTLSSSCQADDPPAPGPADVGATASVVGQIGKYSFDGPVSPNTKIVENIFAGEGDALQLTFVLNEQVPGQSSDGHPGILVNALHVYVGPPGTVYSSQGAIWAQSRCEVAIVPAPPRRDPAGAARRCPPVIRAGRRRRRIGRRPHPAPAARVGDRWFDVPPPFTRHWWTAHAAHA
jgi:hypothetical protein